MTNELNPNAQAWVEALRSGDYKQGHGLLRSDDDKFCCLGVACDLFAASHPEVRGWEIIFNVSNIFVSHTFIINAQKNTALLPRQVCEWLGLAPLVEGGYNKNVTFLQNTPRPRSLVDLNDDRLFTFDKIADTIEANQKELFNAK